jgi:hypothetical protein
VGISEILRYLCYPFGNKALVVCIYERQHFLIGTTRHLAIKFIIKTVAYIYYNNVYVQLKMAGVTIIMVLYYFVCFK